MLGFFSKDREMARWERTRQRMRETGFAWLNGAFAWGVTYAIFMSAFVVLKGEPWSLTIPFFFLAGPTVGYFIGKWGYRKMEARYKAYLEEHALVKQPDSTGSTQS